MIKLMRKVFQAATTVALFLASAPNVLAQTPLPTIKRDITVELPGEAAKSLLGVQPADIPQFLITLLFIVGIVIAIVFLIYGGIKWILSGGDSKQVEGARNHIVAAIVGLIIVVGAFFILNFVFAILTGKPFSLENFCIPSLTDPTCP